MKSKKRRFKWNSIIILSIIVSILSTLGIFLILSSYDRPDIKNLLGELRTQKSFFDASVKIIENICSNGVLEVNEECDDGNNLGSDGCSSDCKIEKIPLPPEGGGGGGGGGSNIEIKKINISCVEDWVCDDWTECSNRKQLRECKDTNNCGAYNLKPETTKDCISPTEEKSSEDIIETPNPSSFISKFFPLFVILLIIILILITIFILYLRKRYKKLKKTRFVVVIRKNNMSKTMY